jgi:hypothetical protein
VPQYGEYAPVAPPNPYGVPGYPTGAASTQTTPATPAYGATNPYGVPASGTQTYGAPAYAPIGGQRKTWDLVLTIVLLVIGAIGALIGATAGLGLNDAIQQQYDAKNLGMYDGNNGAAIAALAISHLVLYVLAVGFSILSLVKKRTTFWIPLVAGVVAAIVFWGVLISLIVGDSTLMNALTSR